MKKNLLLFIAIVFGLHLFSQPIVKIAAYEQYSSPGTVPAGVKDENGNPVKKAAAKSNYFIFLSFNKTYDISPVQLFIRGREFSVKTITTRETPVQVTDNIIPTKPRKQTLVSRTSNKVIELAIGGQVQSTKLTNSLKTLVAKNDIVIVYTWKNKRYFAALKRLGKLASSFNE